MATSPMMVAVEEEREFTAAGRAKETLRKQPRTMPNATMKRATLANLRERSERKRRVRPGRSERSQKETVV